MKGPSMPPRKDPVTTIVDFFESEPLPAVMAVNAVCQAIIRKRATVPTAPARSKLRKVNDDLAVTDHNGITTTVK